MPNLRDFDNPTQCHVIGGPLGVGKTTTIVDALKRRSKQESLAIITNDFGPMGLDGALIEGALDGDDAQRELDITTLPDGCVCCTAAIGFAETMQKLAELDRLDRILVEPSGVALLGQVIDLLWDLGSTYALKLMPTLVVVDVRIASYPPRALEMPIFKNRLEAADVLVANRCDLVEESEVQTFREWTTSLYPEPLLAITTQRGRLPADVFDWSYDSLRQSYNERKAAAGEASRAADRSHLSQPEGCDDERHDEHHHHHDGHTHDGFSADGCMWEADVRFSRSSLESAITRLVGGEINGVRPARFKGIFNTDRGWVLCSYANGANEFAPSHYRRDSRVDWIVIDDEPGNLEKNEVRLLLETALAG